MSLLDKIKKDVSEEETQTVDQQATENLTKEERKALKKAKRTGFTETIKDDYDDSDRTLADSDAHRDVVYTPPSTIRQIGICYMTQMKRFTKEKTIWALLALLVAIPVVYLIMTNVLGVENSHITNVFIATPLFAMPILSMFICSAVCGSMLPREYNERTVYLSLPLPISRFAFYIGKFLAGLTLCWGVITAAYGIAILLALTVGNTDTSYSGPMFTSLLIMMSTVFAFCSFVYMLSAKSKRGSTMKSLILLVVAIPAVIVIVKVLSTTEALESFRGPLESIYGVISYLPVLGPDLAITNLGRSPLYAIFSMDCASLTAFSSMISGGSSLTMDAYLMSFVAIVVGVICLFFGFRKISRRDM